MIFRQFLAPDEQLSYLLADSVTKQAALVDAHVSLEQQYRKAIDQLGLELRFLLETHVHETHVSLAPVFRRELGARLVAHEFARMDCVDQRVRDGDTLFVGEEIIDIIATPGHSGCSISFLSHSRVLTGHSLLCGATGNCRRSDADPVQLNRSIHERLFLLPDETLVFPGHCGGQRRVSCIIDEKLHNREIGKEISQERFIQMKKEGQNNQTAESGPFLRMNRQCGRTH